MIYNKKRYKRANLHIIIDHGVIIIVVFAPKNVVFATSGQIEPA